MNLSAPFIRRPIGTLLLTIGMAMAGIAAFFVLPVSPLPQVDMPTITVTSTLAGASSSTMASSVAGPLEKRLGTIAGVTEMTSQSGLGTTRITLQFDLKRDINGAAADVQAAINAARADLPATLRSNPTYRKVNPADAPILILALTSSSRSPAQIYDAVSTVVQQRLLQVEGVGDVELGGAALPAVRVDLNPLALARYGIALEDVRSALASASANRPRGLKKGGWWSLFDDAVLDALERKVIVSNQNLAAAKAGYDQARAIVRQQRAALLPAVTLQANASDAGAFAPPNSAAMNGTSSSNSASSALKLGIGATWEPDLWGAIGNAVSQSKAQAQVSQAQLANATLSAQGEVALDYLELRGIEAQKAALDTTVTAYQRALTITTNLYNAGVSARSDVLQAETALRNAQADDADYDRQRAILEHAIAVLVGENPSSFSIAPASWNPVVPDVPSILPSKLLERRPDVAAAERSVAAANANIGIQRAAFFPQISLSGQAGQSASGLGMLFSAASSAWSLGLSGVLSLLDFGANKAKVAGARAAYAQTVAEYRQTALVAFQQTEDQLAAVRVLETVASDHAAASSAADRAEAIARNQYTAGLIAYSGVIIAQTTALSARVANIQAVINRQTSAVSLIQAIGGRWD